jgi:hypothetical protein
MTYEQISKLLKIKIFVFTFDETLTEKELPIHIFNPDDSYFVRVKIECLNKTAQWKFTGKEISYNQNRGVTFLSIIQVKIIHEFEIEKWIGEKIEPFISGYWNWRDGSNLENYVIK